MSAAEVFIGVDVGTSGCRAIAIDAGEQIIASAGIGLPPIRQARPGIAEQDAETWWIAFCAVTQALIAQLDGYRPTAICADGNSSTLVITDPAGNPVAPGIMYNDQRGLAALDKLNEIVPADSPVLSASSSLAKLLVAKDQGMVTASARIMHLAEWIIGRLAGRFDTGDEHNCLKLGVERRFRLNQKRAVSNQLSATIFQPTN